MSQDHRLFTELAGEWGVYAKVSQLKALHKWLDRRGTRERTLKVHPLDSLASMLHFTLHRFICASVVVVQRAYQNPSVKKIFGARG